MKKTLVFAGLTLLTSTALAHHKTFGNNPDMYASPLLDHEPSVREMTKQSENYTAIDLDGYQDILPDSDRDQGASPRYSESTARFEDSEFIDHDGYQDIMVN